MLKKLKLNGSMKTIRPFRTNTQKGCPFHYMELECKSRKSRDTWLNSLQSLSHVQLLVTPRTAARQAITNSWSLLKLMPIELVMLSNYLILCHPLLLLPSIFPSIRVISNK